jgi:outer membrane protein TolC
MKRLLILCLIAGSSLCTHVCQAQTKLSASEAVSYALAHRPELRAMEARVTAADDLAKQAGAIQLGLDPVLSTKSTFQM